MSIASYPDGHLSVWRGRDVLSFIDGLSTNLCLDLVEGQCKHTTFTTTSAKVIDRVMIFHMGGFVACVSHGPHWEALLSHITPRILGQDVSITDATQSNDFYVGFNHDNEYNSSYSSENGVTIGSSIDGFEMIIASKGTPMKADSNWDEFDEWRIAQCVPWPGYEITSKHHALASGLPHDVHPAKGCYIGQEVLTRMITRGKQGRSLVTVPNNEAKASEVTTQGSTHSLVITRL